MYGATLETGSQLARRSRIVIGWALVLQHAAARTRTLYDSHFTDHPGDLGDRWTFQSQA
jgi:hypothetical protein